MKARALLGYLAAQHHHQAPRERLAELLWPERHAETSRKNLRNCLYVIGQALGDDRDRLVAEATEIRLTGAFIDIAEFDRLSGIVELVQLRAAARLVRGSFLDGLIVPSEEFDGWLGIERAKRNEAACELFRRLTEAETEAGNYEAAIQAACRLLEWDPLSDAAHRTVMLSYGRAGRRKSALDSYRGFVELLRKDAGLAPEAETEELAQRIAEGASLTADVYPLQRGNIKPTATSLRATPLLETPFSPPPPHWPFLTRQISVGIALLRNLGGTSIEQAIVEAFTDDLVVDLVQHARGLSCAKIAAVNSETSAFRLPGAGDFDYLVLGSAQRGRIAGSIRFALHIVDAASGQYRWAERYECDAEQLPAVQTRITQRVSRELHFLLIQTLSQRAAVAIGHELSLAECLSRGTAVLKSGVTPTSTADAQLWFLAALARDPRNAEALLGVALTCQYIVSQPWWSGSAAPETAFAIGQTVANTVLDLNPNNATANSFKGMMYSAAGDTGGAARAFQASISDDPSIAFVHAYAGYNNAFLGRAESVREGVQRAHDLGGTDRLHSIWYFFAGFAELLLGSEDAMPLLRKSLELNPEYGSAQLFLAAALSMHGRRFEAMQIASEFRSHFPSYQTRTFDQQWLWRSTNSVYRRQIDPIADQIHKLGLPH